MAGDGVKALSHGFVSPAASDDQPAADLQAILDNQRFGRFQLATLGVVAFLAWADGCDLQVSSFAAPDLARDWGIAKSGLAPFLSAGLFGLLIGSPLLGWLGDRRGRKPAVLVSCACIAVFSLVCATATSLPMLIAARVASGIFIGGLMPNLIALTAEIAPSRRRASAIVLTSAGVGLGALSTASLMTVWPWLHAWRNLFLFSAAAPALGGLIGVVLLPESPALLTRSTRRAADLLRLVNRIRPELRLTRVPDSDVAPTRVPLGALFAGSLALVTPALWLLAALVFLTAYLVTSWTPVLMLGSGMSEAEAGRAVSFLHAGGTVGTFAAASVVDRFGWKVIGGYALIAMIGAACVGFGQAGPALVPWFVALLGFGLVGAQCSLNAAAGLTYATDVRSRGTGLVFAMSRIGSIGGPFLGAALLVSGFGGRQFYLATLVPLLMSLALTGFILGLRGRQFGSVDARSPGL